LEAELKTHLTDQPAEENAGHRHPHVHALTHALATAGQVYADAVAGLVTSSHPPAWQRAVDEYDRAHPSTGGDS